jgi:hypothetical protein
MQYTPLISVSGFPNLSAPITRLIRVEIIQAEGLINGNFIEKCLNHYVAAILYGLV